MSRASSWLRLCAGSALLVVLVPRADAWDLLHRCHTDCNSQTIQIPGQQVVVETVRPRVVVQDSRPLRLSNFAAAPMIASFYVPMPVNLGAVGLSTSNTSEERASVTLDFSALEAAHELERSQARLTAIQAIQDAQTQHVKAVMARVAAVAAAAGQPPTATPKSSATDTCCDNLQTQLQNLANRVDHLETLVLKHDQAIRKDPAIKVPDPAK